LCGLASSGQGFHIIQGEDFGVSLKDMANCALITITKGSITRKQLENEFRAQAGQNYIWRWFEKKEWQTINSK